MATTASKPEKHESTEAESTASRSRSLRVCAECKYAQLFAVRPRAVCTREGSAAAGKTLFAGQPACPDMSPRDDAELVLSIYGLQRMPSPCAPTRVH